MKRIYLPCILILLTVLFFSCHREHTARLYLDGNFSYTLCDESSDIDEAENLSYKPLNLSGYKNLAKEIGREGEVTWLKTTFKLPDDLKNRDLGMVIPYLHYACKLYLNGEFIDAYGFMEEPRQEAGFSSQLYNFPKKLLNQEGENVILIKVLLLGQATISNGVFIGERTDTLSEADFHTFWQSRFYYYFEGVLIGVFITFLLLFNANKRFKHYLYFSLLAFNTFIFFSNFFAGDLPDVGFHGGLNFFIYLKITRCLAFFAMEFLFALFIISFLGIPQKKIVAVLRTLCSIACAVSVIAAKDYLALMKMTPYLLAISGLDVVISFFVVAIRCFSKNKVMAKRAHFLALAFAPLLLAFIGDFIIKIMIGNIQVTYLSLPAFGVSIVILFSYFTMQYKAISNRLEYLNRSLEDEVEIRTRQLAAANEQLEDERETIQEDMSMAALVQKKFFHAPTHSLSKWDLSVRYEPLSIVSGDLFNFYTDGDELKGVSIFDASGHGVAASLVTMLAENIIQQAYHESLENGRGVAETLTVINDRFINAKDGIENYLTGILLSTKENPDGSCTVVMANAGHPNPLLYVAASGTVEEILPDVSSPSFGAVGIKGFEVCYSEIEFTMNSGDVLLLFTDGLIEMKDENHEEFGINRTMNVLNEIHGMSASEMLSAMMFAFNAHVYSVPRTDDVSVIVLKRK
ncbi:MAG: serine/threonine-protein phosphatase [Treponema sp.]|nr:serine/threonine-protein phosphatase [Treponema sp.]